LSRRFNNGPHFHPALTFPGYHKRQSHPPLDWGFSVPATNLQLEQELEERVQQQIQAFKARKIMSERDILEFHLRHYRIRTLFEAMDRQMRQRCRW
jgi:hypothetical protein